MKPTFIKKWRHKILIARSICENKIQHESKECQKAYKDFCEFYYENRILQIPKSPRNEFYNSDSFQIKSLTMTWQTN